MVVSAVEENSKEGGTRRKVGEKQEMQFWTKCLRGCSRESASGKDEKSGRDEPDTYMQKSFPGRGAARGSRGWVGRVRAEAGSRAAMPGPSDPLWGAWLFLSVKWEAIKGLSSSVKAWGFPGSSDASQVKNLPVKAGDAGD